MRVHILLICSLLMVGPALADLNIVPKPKVIEYSQAMPLLLGEDSVAIVLGDTAVEAEEYAVETLQKMVKRRFGQIWPIRRESENLKAYKVVVLLGQRGTNAMLDRLCDQWKVDLSEQFPGPDGYVIQMGSSEGREAILVGGSNARAVIYGQDTLFQLLSKEDGKLALTRASVRDRPSIPWRGRPHTWNDQYLRPGVMDAYARARINFIDLRDGPVPRRGQYAYPPGFKLDVPQVTTVLKEAHRRGMFVYATVSCAVAERDFDAAIETYEELIALGADSLYISIDDPGAEFRFGTPLALIERVIELGRKHGMTGHKIAIVPGKGSYGKILTEVNRKVAQIPGMDEALWFFTTVPSAQNLADARSIGLKSKPCWWHNWPRPAGGFTHGAYGGGSLRKDGKTAYMEVPPLSAGWGDAGYDVLAEAAEHVDAIMPWGGSGWGPEYTSHVLGWWAWAPELHDWEAVRRRIYDVVYGPDQVDAAFQFDEWLAELKDYFVRPGKGTEGPAGEVNAGWPLKLKHPSDKADLGEFLPEMEQLLDTLESRAPNQTLIEPELLRRYYLEPMRAGLRIAELTISVPFPEYWWKAHESRVLAAVNAGNLQQAAEWTQAARERASQEARRVHEVLGGELNGIDEYAQSWDRRLAPMPRITKASRPPRMSGDLSDPLWEGAEKLNLTGGSPGNETEVRLLYTEDALYAGFLCREPNVDQVVAKWTARDSNVWEDDSVEVVLDPSALQGTYFQFISNVNGVRLDGRRLPGRPFDHAWDGDWEVKTARGKDRWTAEFRIPFKSLGIGSPAKGSIWLFNFARNDRVAEENVMGESYELSAWTPGRMHDTSAFRPIEFVELRQLK